MKVSGGTLLQSRVVDTLELLLADALDRELTGYARIEPSDLMLFDQNGREVLTFADGVPMAAYHTGTEATGLPALQDLPELGPYHIEVYRLPATQLQTVHAETELLVPPDRPAERFTEDHALIERTRTAAPETRMKTGPADDDALASFLADEERIESLRSEARRQATARAEEWGLADQLDHPEGNE